MAKFLKIYCHGNPCSYTQNTEDWGGGDSYHGNVGINTQGAGSSSEGYHLINLDEVLSISTSPSGGSLNDAGRLEIILKGSPSIQYGGGVEGVSPINITPKKIQFIFGCCTQETQGVAPQLLKLIDTKEIADLAGDESQLFKAHRQLIETIDSQPEGVVEWIPQGIKGYYDYEAQAIVKDVYLLGYVYYNLSSSSGGGGTDYTFEETMQQIDKSSSFYNQLNTGRFVGPPQAGDQLDSLRFETFSNWFLYPTEFPNNFIQRYTGGEDPFTNPIWQLNLPNNEKGEPQIILIGPGVNTSNEAPYPYPAANFLDIGVIGNAEKGEPLSGVIWGIPIEGIYPNPLVTWQLGNLDWEAVESKIQLAYTNVGYRKNGFEQWNDGAINPAPDPNGEA